MKNPLLVLASTVLVTVAIPVFISVFTYDSDIKQNDNSINQFNIKSKGTKKIINYETVNKESPNIKVYNHKKGQVEKFNKKFGFSTEK